MTNPAFRGAAFREFREVVERTIERGSKVAGRGQLRNRGTPGREGDVAVGVLGGHLGQGRVQARPEAAGLGGDDGFVNTAMVIGDFFQPTDWAPDEGHGTIEPFGDAPTHRRLARAHEPEQHDVALGPGGGHQ